MNVACNTTLWRLTCSMPHSIRRLRCSCPSIHVGRIHKVLETDQQFETDLTPGGTDPADKPHEPTGGICPHENPPHRRPDRWRRRSWPERRDPCRLHDGDGRTWLGSR